MNAVTYSLFGLQVPFAPDFESTVDQFEQNFLATQTSGFSAALNAEKLYMAQKDASVFNLLSAASFRYLDGIGAVWAARRKYNLPFARVPGVELWLQIAKRAARRGLKIAIIGGFFTLLISSLAGYGFEVFSSKARERLYNGMLLTLMVPFAALMIPLFILMAQFDLLDTHLAVILPALASAYIIFYFRQSTKAFPPELRLS